MRLHIHRWFAHPEYGGEKPQRVRVWHHSDWRRMPLPPIKDHLHGFITRFIKCYECPAMRQQWKYGDAPVAAQ